MTTLTRAKVLANIKEANQLVDQLKREAVDSFMYGEHMDTLDLILEILEMNASFYTLHKSKKTGHYFVKFAQ